MFSPRPSHSLPSFALPPAQQRPSTPQLLNFRHLPRVFSQARGQRCSPPTPRAPRYSTRVPATHKFLGARLLRGWCITYGRDSAAVGPLRATGLFRAHVRDTQRPLSPAPLHISQRHPRCQHRRRGPAPAEPMIGPPSLEKLASPIDRRAPQRLETAEHRRPPSVPAVPCPPTQASAAPHGAITRVGCRHNNPAAGHARGSHARRGRSSAPPTGSTRLHLAPGPTRAAVSPATAAAVGGRAPPRCERYLDPGRRDGPPRRHLPSPRPRPPRRRVAARNPPRSTTQPPQISCL